MHSSLTLGPHIRGKPCWFFLNTFFRIWGLFAVLYLKFLLQFNHWSSFFLILTKFSLSLFISTKNTSFSPPRTLAYYTSSSAFFSPASKVSLCFLNFVSPFLPYQSAHICYPNLTGFVYLWWHSYFLDYQTFLFYAFPNALIHEVSSKVPVKLI